MMKIAVLVLAASAPTVLEWQLKTFLDERYSFFVHVDKKMSFEPFRFLRSCKNVTVVENRFDVYWGGFNMIRAELELLRMSLTDASFTRFILISDDSFTLRSPNEICQSLAEDCEWMGLHKVKDELVLRRYEAFYSVDSAASTAKFIPPSERIWNSNAISALDGLQKLMWRGKKPLTNLFQGPQWWCITRQAAHHILEVVAHDWHLQNSFKYSLIPDEHYIQTIIGLSERFRVRASHMYTDFSRQPKPFLFNTFDDLEKPYASDRLFLRKVASNTELLQLMAARAS